MGAKYFLTVCLNPVLQRTMRFESWRENEVNRTDEYYLHASGKGVNVTRVLTQLGEPAVHLTHAGGRDRELFLQMCREDGLDVAWEESGSPIRTCTTLLNRQTKSSTELVEEALPVEPATEGRIRKRFSALISQAEMLIVSGTRAPGYSEEFYPWMVGQARSTGVTVVLDIKGADLKRCLPYGPNIVKPNFSEFAATFLSGMAVGEHEDDPQANKAVEEKMSSLHREYDISIVLTRGSRGVMACGEDGILHRPAKLLSPVNTIGCGDAFTAGFSARFARGGTLSEAIDAGTDCAAANAVRLKPGVILD